MIFFGDIFQAVMAFSFPQNNKIEGSWYCVQHHSSHSFSTETMGNGWVTHQQDPYPVLVTHHQMHKSQIKWLLDRIPA